MDAAETQKVVGAPGLHLRAKERWLRSHRGSQGRSGSPTFRSTVRTKELGAGLVDCHQEATGTEVMLRYRLRLEPDDNGTVLVTSPDLPIVTYGVGEDRGASQRRRCHQDTIIESMMRARDDVPMPPQGASGDPFYGVPLQTELKIQTASSAEGSRFDTRRPCSSSGLESRVRRSTVPFGASVQDRAGRASVRGSRELGLHRGQGRRPPNRFRKSGLSERRQCERQRCNRHSIASDTFFVGGGKARSRSVRSWSDSVNSAAARFSSTCATVPALGIANTSGRRRSQASATLQARRVVALGDLVQRRMPDEPSLLDRAVGRERHRAASPSAAAGRTPGRDATGCREPGWSNRRRRRPPAGLPCRRRRSC